MITVQQAITKAEKLLPGIPTPEGQNDPRWQAIIKVGEFIESNPQEVWLFIRKWGVHPSEDVRIAVATCLLEHLLGYHFEKYYPLVRDAARKSRRFASTFSHTWDQSELPENSQAFDELKKKSRLREIVPQRNGT